MSPPFQTRTEALAMGGEEGRKFVVEETMKKDRNILIGIANQIIPASRRRSKAPEDVFQATMLRLYIFLGGPHSLTNSDEVRRFTCRIIRCLSLNTVRDESRQRGATEVVPVNKEGESPDCHEALEEMASVSRTVEPSPDEKMLVDELQEAGNSFTQAMEAELQKQPERSRAALDMWLEGATLERIVGELQAEQYQVRKWIYDFQNRQPLLHLVKAMRPNWGTDDDHWYRLSGQLSLSSRTRRFLEKRRAKP